MTSEAFGAENVRFPPALWRGRLDPDVQPISDDQLVKLVSALAEAARADQRTPERFVPPRTGILEETAARRHHFVFGRRGVGKSTLLRKIESLRESETDVIFVDIETLRGRPYPDVLIELLIELLDTVSHRLRPPVWRVDELVRRQPMRRELGQLLATLSELLNQPQSAERTIRELRSKTTTRTREAGAGGRIESRRLSARARIGAASDSAVESEDASKAVFVESKMEGLLGAAVLIRSALERAQRHLDGRATLVVLDDFYHIPYDDQPDVLAYLHQIVKNLEIYLKVCSVRHRLQPFVEGNPPRGMQVGQDASEVSLDITLERFSAAQLFLEQVLAGICTPHGVDLVDLATDGGRQRLVLASGGVARDYLYLTQVSLRNANERDVNPSRPHNRIGAEDVNEAAAVLSAQKQQDLSRDAGENADQLRARLTDVSKFCLDVRRTNVFLVEGPKLQEEDWGKEIQALADLRLVHEIGNLSVNTGSYRGRRFVGFTLDLSNYTGTRSERIRPIAFWEREGRQEARGARLIYEPGMADGHEGDPEDATEEQLDGEWEQFTIDIPDDGSRR